ncbi:hypothetical protein JL475_32745 [Streptomyces sp. M2CJ-2]|uniref:hypothetical protein n=1 Tax=Streptomyces sp. M2CJ-2 TaxID=2803948 RepID=UPI0019262127|nr:hypothetical protein [Streptomyces sp. M2CJ-2]MBL3670656.1 hypothetical protein [Streptomyces sp. M2CJ-2]
MSETTHPIALRTDRALLLPLPEASTLSDAQRRGAACAWCRIPLTTETARDAGERPAADGTRIWPRGCAPCAGRAAYRLLLDHAPACARCQTDPTCPVAVAAQRLIKEGGL